MSGLISFIFISNEKFIDNKFQKKSFLSKDFDKNIINKIKAILDPTSQVFPSTSKTLKIPQKFYKTTKNLQIAVERTHFRQFHP